MLESAQKINYSKFTCETFLNNIIKRYQQCGKNKQVFDRYLERLGFVEIDDTPPVFLHKAHKVVVKYETTIYNKDVEDDPVLKNLLCPTVIADDLFIQPFVDCTPLHDLDVETLNMGIYEGKIMVYDW